MTVADGSQVRLADIAETVIGTTPATPAFQVMRYLTADVRPQKQTDIPDEVRADRNVGSIVDVGRSISGTINGLLSYGTYDTWLERLLCSSWTGDVLKNGTLAKTATLEETFVQGASSSFLRFRGCRWNTLDLQLTARQSISANWGIMGIDSPTPTAAIITGATYTAPTTTPVMNAGLNVAGLLLTGTDITASPKMQQLSMSIKNNIYQNDVVGSYAPYSHGLGRFEVSGSMNCYFEDIYTYQAILNHSDVGLSFTVGNSTGQKYTIALENVKLMDGGPTAPGNGKAVMMNTTFQAYYGPTSAASMSITRAVA